MQSVTINAANGAEVNTAEGGGVTWEGDGDNEIIFGTMWNDMLDGDYGDDLLYGFEGDDIIEGGYGKDRLFGDAGDDTMCIGNEVSNFVAPELKNYGLISEGVAYLSGASFDGPSSPLNVG